jgi:hypothetical protein
MTISGTFTRTCAKAHTLIGFQDDDCPLCGVLDAPLWAGTVNDHIKALARIKRERAAAMEGVCELCGEPMPEGEEMFRFHGLSGPCPTDRSPR